MCGIGGVYLKKSARLDLRKPLAQMLRIQNHRGPDASGYWISNDNSIGVCHNRLSIIDTRSAGNQPMHSIDQRYSIVYNGEIYNYKELKKELVDFGSKFINETDTEVLIESYRRWGKDMLYRIRGMFAFAIYDSISRELFCARDRVGKKPFVYSQTRIGFIFASEIPAVASNPAVDLSYNRSGLAAMLLHNLRHIPDPHTAFTAINRLRAGHAMIVKDGLIEAQWRYWTPSVSSLDPTSENLRAVLNNAIQIRMQADVPVGALLSGGVDSSAIAAIMSKSKTSDIHTYALGFDKNDEDILRARQMSKYIGSNHKEFYFNPTEQWSIFKKLINIHGEPIALLPLIHAYTLSVGIRNDGIKVVMTGNGADEIFYGYVGHLRTSRISKYLNYINKIRPLFHSFTNTKIGFLTSKPGERKAAFYGALGAKSWRGTISDEAICEIKNLVAEEMKYWGNLCPSEEYIDESNFVALMIENTHSVTTACDLPAMAASVEFRAPFLDQDIISFALGTPHGLKIQTNRPPRLKAILRDAVSDLLPDNLLRAPKRGFGHGIQEASLLQTGWRKCADEYLSEPHTAGGLFSQEKIIKSWDDFQKGLNPAMDIMKQLSIQVWLRNAEG